MHKNYNIEAINLVGKQVLLKGWIHARRNMGKIIFIDLRDSTGLIQIVLVANELDDYSKKIMDSLRTEFCVSIKGAVQKRDEKQINPNLETGAVEVLAKNIEILSEAKTPPFEVDKDTIRISEEARLEYRYLDLRSERMAENIRMRSKVMNFVRNYLTSKKFTEIQTPILSKSTPEGARDYLVPSRVHKGKFFALPQAPQQYKQLLMAAGFEKYFQIAPCFRDEDARADRSPGEFYQIDIEMSFCRQGDILNLVEEMFVNMIKKLYPGKQITTNPWPRLKYEDAIKKYGTDKPDLRKNKEDINELAFAWIVDFPLFAKQAENDFFYGAGNKLAPSHNMFTAPKDEDIPLLDKNPEKVKSYQHDLVLNGIEVGGGALRIYNAKLQEKIFDLIGFTEKDKKMFSHLLKAFEYGVPPHGGIAPGLDRLVSILQGEKNIREVIAFPLTGDARDPLMGAPSKVSEEQLKELGIKIIQKNNKKDK